MPFASLEKSAGFSVRRSQNSFRVYEKSPWCSMSRGMVYTGAYIKYPYSKSAPEWIQRVRMSGTSSGTDISLASLRTITLSC